MDACNWDLRRFRLVDINLHYKGALWADGTGIGHSFLHVWIESTVPCHREAIKENSEIGVHAVQSTSNFVGSCGQLK